MFRKLWAFYKRDWQLAMTFRLNAFQAPLRTLALLLPFFFIGKIVKDGNYFRFVLLGIAFSQFMGTALGGFKRMIAFERGHGTLEAILSTPTSFTAMALSRTLWDLTAVSAQTAVYLLIGSLFFHVDLSQANWIAFLPVIALTAGTFLGLGMVFAGFSLVWRGGSPLEFLFGGGSRFLSGVYFPVGILPAWLRVFSQCLPLTYALEAIRKSLVHGASLFTLGREVGVLLVFSILLIPAGWFFFRWSLAEARRLGTLGFE